jgi:hypothetical protein
MPEKTYRPSAKSEKALKLKPGSGYSIFPDLPPPVLLNKKQMQNKQKKPRKKLIIT